MFTEAETPLGGAPHGAFATTHWSVVLASAGHSVESMEALEKLCRAYWYPIYSHVRRGGFSPEDAEDLTQGFFASLLRHDSLAAIRREKGRFRTFLLSSLGYFLADQSDRAGIHSNAKTFDLGDEAREIAVGWRGFRILHRMRGEDLPEFSAARE